MAQLIESATHRIIRLEVFWGVAWCGPEMRGEDMKYLFAAVLLASTVAGFGASNAAGGCGPGMHRGPYGGCRVNGGVSVVERPGVVESPVVVRRPSCVLQIGFSFRS